jgi:hypothetical protein
LFLYRLISFDIRARVQRGPGARSYFNYKLKLIFCQVAGILKDR